MKLSRNRVISGSTILCAVGITAISLLCVPKAIAAGCPGGCIGRRSALATIFIPDDVFNPISGRTINIEASGPASADVFDNGGETINMIWRESEFSGFDPILGTIDFKLSNSYQSTGLISSITRDPIGGCILEGLLTNDLFFEFNFGNVPFTMVSNGPATLSGIINDIPPIGSVFTLDIPTSQPLGLELYRLGDPNKTPLAYIVKDEVIFLPVPGPLPILGLGATFGWSRRLRNRITHLKFPIVTSAIG